MTYTYSLFCFRCYGNLMVNKFSIQVILFYELSSRILENRYKRKNGLPTNKRRPVHQNYLYIGKTIVKNLLFTLNNPIKACSDISVTPPLVAENTARYSRGILCKVPPTRAKQKYRTDRR